MSLKVKDSERVLANLDFEEKKKKSQHLIEEYNNLFGPFENLESKLAFEAKIPKFRSFLMMLDELGQESSSFYAVKNKEIIEDHAEISKIEKKYSEIITKFQGKL